MASYAECGVIPLREIASALNPSPVGRRFVAILRFFADESYDSDPQSKTGMSFYDADRKQSVHVPRTYVVGGFISDETIWENVERQWRAENERAGVKHYHATEVNAYAGEFKDWDGDQSIQYSKNLVGILKGQGRRLHAVTCALWASDYYRLISAEGRRKFGPPYIGCFKTCVAMIAQAMDVGGFQPEDKFAVILHRSDFEKEAVELFYKMKDSVEWPYHNRLATCAPGSCDDFTPLEAADLIAYETFRIVNDGATGDGVRKALASMFDANGFMGYGIDGERLERLKEPMESAVCIDNGFVPIFRQFQVP